MAKVTHWIQVGTAKIGFLAQDNYSSIGPVVGITKLAAGDHVDAMSTVGNLFKSGTALRMKIRYKAGSSTKTASIVCDINKAASAVGGLIGTSYKGGTVSSASLPRRRRLG